MRLRSQIVAEEWHRATHLQKRRRMFAASEKSNCPQHLQRISCLGSPDSGVEDSKERIEHGERALIYTDLLRKRRHRSLRSRMVQNKGRLLAKDYRMRIYKQLK